MAFLWGHCIFFGASYCAFQESKHSQNVQCLALTLRKIEGQVYQGGSELPQNWDTMPPPTLDISPDPKCTHIDLKDSQILSI